MKTSEFLANKTYEKLTEGRKSIDPVTILIIVEIINSVIKALQECKKNREEAKKMMNSPSMITRWRFKTLVNKSNYTGDKAKLVQALYHTGKNITSVEVADLFNENRII